MCRFIKTIGYNYISPVIMLNVASYDRNGTLLEVFARCNCEVDRDAVGCLLVVSHLSDIRFCERRMNPVAVRIRMKKLGRRHRPFFRICAMDSRSPRDGNVIEELGTYDPMLSDTNRRVKLNDDRIQYWLSVGAKPTEKVQTLLKKYIGTSPEDFPVPEPKQSPPVASVSESKPAEAASDTAEAASDTAEAASDTAEAASDTAEAASESTEESSEE